MESLPDLGSLMTEIGKECCGDVLAKVDGIYPSCQALEREKAAALAELDRLEHREQELAVLCSDEYKNLLEWLETYIEELNPENCRKATVEQMLEKTYQKWSARLTKRNYRHKLYLTLLFCSLYYSKPKEQDTFLSIDEAQDISVAEYNLLYQILGKQCVFNLYGDVNQLVYEYKGITDWEDLQFLVGENVAVLNEDYRNTSQITDYCNGEFECGLQPIGISGPEVREMPAHEALMWLRDLKRKNPEFRTAVIYRYGVKSVKRMLEKEFQDDQVSWGTPDSDRISVISVESAKGMEFEAVVVIADQMNDNERYVAYTRSLSDLVVVRDQFESGIEEEGSETSSGTLIEYVRTMKMSYSYKPVLILALLKYGQAKGEISIEDAARFFRDYYGKRRQAGLVVEKGNCIYLREDVSDREIINNLVSNPVNALRSSGLFVYKKKDRLFGFVTELIPNEEERKVLERVCHERLQEYYVK